LCIVPSDDLSKYKEAIGLNVSRNYFEGSDVHLSFMAYRHQASFVKFCHFPKNAYNLSSNPLYSSHFNHSTCCVCVSGDCSSCKKTIISSITDPVRSSYNFTIHLNDLTQEDYGLYTMIACVYEVIKDNCGYDAWVEVLVQVSRSETFWKKFHLVFEIGVPFLIGLVALAVVFILYCFITGM